jgi:hypothetical protein
VEAGQGLIRVPQYPEGPSGKASATNTQIVAYAECRRTVLVCRVVCDAVLQVLAGRRQRAKPPPRYPKGIVGDDRERGVMATLRQAQEGFSEFSRRVQLRPCHRKPPQPKQHRDQLRRLAHLLTQRACLGVGVLHLGRCLPFGYQQGRAEGNVQG